MSSNQVPSIGRVVHFIPTHGEHCPADICTVVSDTVVHLFVKDAEDGLAKFVYNVDLDVDGLVVHTWHWPEYVAPRSS